MLTLVFACSWEGYGGYGLENRRNHPLEVTLRVAHACEDQSDLSQQAAFGPAVRQTLLAGDLVSLLSLELLEPGDEAEQGKCAAVWLTIPDLFDGVLAWDQAPFWDMFDDPFLHAVVVEGTRDELALHLPDEIRELPAPRP